MPSGGVARCSDWMTISGQKKSFQCDTNEKMPKATHRRHRRRQHDAPDDRELAQPVEARGVHEIVGHRA